MSTRLTNGAKNAAKEAIQQLLSCGVKFIDCPLTDEEMLTLHTSLLDPEYVAALELLKSKGFALDYYCMDDDADFYVHEANVLHAVAFKVRGQTFYKPPPSQIKDAPTFRIEFPDKPRNYTRVDKKITTTYDNLIAFMGREKFQEFRTWMLACDTMIADLRVSNKVVEDLFEMIKTAGQLKRMVPDLFQYIPMEQREAFDDQKRASSYPFEWAGYPRKDVDTMINTVMKCYLLRGSEKERNKDRNIHQLGNWSETRYGVSTKEKKDE